MRAAPAALAAVCAAMVLAAASSAGARARSRASGSPPPGVAAPGHRRDLIDYLEETGRCADGQGRAPVPAAR